MYWLVDRTFDSMDISSFKKKEYVRNTIDWSYINLVPISRGFTSKIQITQDTSL